MPASSGNSASSADRGGQVVERARGRRRWGRGRSGSSGRAPGGGRPRAATGRAGRRPGGGSSPRPAPCRPSSSAPCAAGPRARPSRARRSGRGRPPAGPPAPRGGCAPARGRGCGRPRPTGPTASRSVSGPAERRRRAGAAVSSSRDGVGRHDRDRLAPARPGRRSSRGCSAPSRRRGRGSSPLQRWSQPVAEPARRGGRSRTARSSAMSRSCIGLPRLRGCDRPRTRRRTAAGRRGSRGAARSPRSMPRANRSGPQSRDDLGGPAAHRRALGLGQAGDPGERGGQLVARRAGRTAGRWSRRARAPASRRSPRGRRPAAAARTPPPR